MLKTSPRANLDPANLVRLASLLFVMTFSSGARGSDTEPSLDPSAEPEQQVDAWIRQLDSQQFAKRNEASRQLESAGQQAFPALAKAAVEGSREVVLRALDILRKHFKDGDAKVKAAAQETLEKVAASDDASASARAKDILNPRKPPAPGVLPLGPVQIQVRVNAAAGGQVRRIQINNGFREIQVEEDGRKIKIKEDANGAIEVELTEKKNGQEVTTKFAAKNEQDLKKKHPEAHKLYQKHGGQNGVIQVLAGRNQPGQVPANAIPQQRQPANGIRVQVIERAVAAQLKHARRMLEMASRQLEQLPQDENDEDTKTRKASRDRLGKIIKQLEEEEQRLTAE